MKIPIIPIISMENSHQFSKSSKVTTGVFIGVRGRARGWAVFGLSIYRGSNIRYSRFLLLTSFEEITWF